MRGASQPRPESTPQAAPSLRSPGPRTISGLQRRVEPVPAPPGESSVQDLCLKDVVVYPERGAGESEQAEALRVEFPFDTHFFAGLEGDVSCGGLFVATYHVVPAGTMVRLAFELPGGTRIEARGQVRWIRDHDSPTMRRGLAIAFVDAEASILQPIAEFCSVRAPFFFDLD